MNRKKTQIVLFSWITSIAVGVGAIAFMVPHREARQADSAQPDVVPASELRVPAVDMVAAVKKSFDSSSMASPALKWCSEKHSFLPIVGTWGYYSESPDVIGAIAVSTPGVSQDILGSSRCLTEQDSTYVSEDVTLKIFGDVFVWATGTDPQKRSEIVERMHRIASPWIASCKKNEARDSERSVINEPYVGIAVKTEVRSDITPTFNPVQLAEPIKPVSLPKATPNDTLGLSLPPKVQRPEVPQKPSAPKESEEVRWSMSDKEGPGCGWSFVGIKPPFIDDSKQAELASKGQSDAKVRLNKEWSLYEEKLNEYNASAAKYNEQMNDYAMYSNEVGALKVKWKAQLRKEAEERRVARLRAIYQKALLEYDRQITACSQRTLVTPTVTKTITEMIDITKTITPTSTATLTEPPEEPEGEPTITVVIETGEPQEIVTQSPSPTTSVKVLAPKFESLRHRCPPVSPTMGR